MPAQLSHRGMGVFIHQLPALQTGVSLWGGQSTLQSPALALLGPGIKQTAFCGLGESPEA